MIVDERMTAYINSLDRGHTPFLEELERKAKEGRIPVIRREMQSFLKVFLMMQKPRKILEVEQQWDFPRFLWLNTAGGLSDHHDRELREADTGSTEEFPGVGI